MSGKDTYLNRSEDYPQKHKYRPKTHALKGTTATNDTKLMEWKSSDNSRAEVIVNELKEKAYPWTGWITFLCIIDTS